jgi:Predicted translation initiation factor 2B subunit, eIF-2B alpha/beta/delta family
MAKESPLFWPVKLKDDTIYILDETLLPQKLSYLKARDLKGACKAIKEMKTRAVGQVLLVMYAFLLVMKQNKTKKNLLPVLEKAAKEIVATRPTLSFKMLTEMVLGWQKAGAPLEKCILGFLESLRAKRIEQAKDASQLIKIRM